MVHKTNNIVYDRNIDGDYKVTIQERIANIYIRKQDFYTENKVFPYAEMSDLRPDLIKRARQMAINNSRKPHIWADMSDEEMLRSMDFYAKDLNTGKEGLILAAILIFGKDKTIMSALPHHKTDAIYRVKDLDRYDDRDDIRTNLLDSYDRLIDFVDKHLDDKFYIEGTQRIDVRNKIARELCSNILMHREFSPYPKNPKIANFFKEIGLADELGSGIRNMVKYTKIYSGGVPEFKENDIFTTIIPLNDTVNAPVNEPVNALVKLNNTQKLIIKLMRENNQITQIELSKELKVNESTIKRNISKLRNKGMLRRIGSDKNGYWEVSSEK